MRSQNRRTQALAAQAAAEAAQAPAGGIPASPRRASRRHPGRIQGYEIRVAGQLEEASLEWYGEISVANQSNGDALLSGSIPDQAALLRVLLRLDELGMTILMVKALKKRKKRTESGKQYRFSSRDHI
jgi:hypothetical protein